MAEPLTYPGRIPATSGLLVYDRFTPLRPVENERPGEWLDNSTRLDTIVERLGVPPLAARYPVVAVGSNASPSQMRRKFVASAVIPMTLADVRGIAPGVSAHVSKAGYIPAAPMETPGMGSRLFVLWLDTAQLHALDITEPNYRRRLLPAHHFPVTLESGVPLQECFVYVGEHGCLVDESGEPRRLTDQPALISRLLAESAGLRRLCGVTPADFVQRVREAGVRDAVRRLFRYERRARPQPGLETLPIDP